MVLSLEHVQLLLFCAMHQPPWIGTLPLSLLLMTRLDEMQNSIKVGSCGTCMRVYARIQSLHPLRPLPEHETEEKIWLQI
jgi:hypothetical protein